MKKIIITTLIINLLIIGCKKEKKHEEQVIKSKISNIDALPNNPQNYCETCGTSYNKDFGCHVDSDLSSEDLVCEENGVCGMILINLEMTDNGYNPIALSIPYITRDSFLINFTKGREYITYYNLLSDIVFEKNAINASNLLDHISLTNKTINAANILMSGANSSIPFDNAYKIEALDMISYYRTLESATYYQNILNIIESDIILWTNKTKSEILSMY